MEIKGYCGRNFQSTFKSVLVHKKTFMFVIISTNQQKWDRITDVPIQNQIS